MKEERKTAAAAAATTAVFAQFLKVSESHESGKPLIKTLKERKRERKREREREKFNFKNFVLQGL